MIAEKYINPLAEITQFDENQLQLYRNNEKNYLDFTASLETSFKDGKKERNIEIAKNLITLGADNDFISIQAQLPPK